MIAITGTKRKADGCGNGSEPSDIISLSPYDTGFNRLVDASFRKVFYGPEAILKKHPTGMSVEEKESGRVFYPPDKVLFSLWNNDPERYAQLKADMFANPKCGGLDFFTEGLYKNLNDNATEEFYEKESHCSFSAALDTPGAVKRSLDLEQFGNTRFFVPKYTEETSDSPLNFAGYKNQANSSFLLGRFNTMKLFDFIPTYFDSDEEAAVYFEHTVRQFLPKEAFAEKVNTICELKQVQADVSAICFSGIGQWFMSAIAWTGKEGETQRVPEWTNREAKDSCLSQVPSTAVVVVDVSMASAHKVRDEFERYGAAAFLDKDRKLLCVWIDHEEEMVFPPAEGAARLSTKARDWEFAQWRWRVSVFFEGFAVGHLVTVHWGMSNSLVIGTRESLDPHHPLRELITPYIHNAITINKSAIVNLGSDRGAIVRIGALAIGQCEDLVGGLADQFKYETFPEFLARKGKFPVGMLESLPMVEDGLKLWNVIETFVTTYLGLYYDREECEQANKTVAQDPDVVAFWAKCRSTSSNFCKLPELSFDNLVGYISTCIFYFTGVHELLGNVNMMTMMPRCLSGRIHKRDRFGDHPFQASIQDWYRIICVVSSTTLESVPRLIPQQFRSSGYFFNKASEDAGREVKELDRMNFRGVGRQSEEDGKEAKEYKTARHLELAMCFQTYGDSLMALSKEIAASNVIRERDGTGTFGSFDPKRLEISVSL